MSRGRLVGIVVSAATVSDELLDEDGGITPVAELFIRRVEWSDAGRGGAGRMRGFRSDARPGKAERRNERVLCSCPAREAKPYSTDIHGVR